MECGSTFASATFGLHFFLSHSPPVLEWRVVCRTEKDSSIYQLPAVRLMGEGEVPGGEGLPGVPSGEIHQCFADQLQESLLPPLLEFVEALFEFVT